MNISAVSLSQRLSRLCCIVFASLVTCCPSNAAAAISATHLSTNDLFNPYIDASSTPLVSWQLATSSPSLLDLSQQAYRIVASTSPLCRADALSRGAQQADESGGDAWRYDSGWIASSKTLSVPLSLATMSASVKASMPRIYWSVSVLERRTQSTVTSSELAYFELTAFIESTTPPTTWISRGAPPPTSTCEFCRCRESFVFCLLSFVFCVLCFVFCVLCFVCCVLCFVFCVFCFCFVFCV
jgi:hypothetical protein